MSADVESAGVNSRPVRPWIAALLTFFGWGLGFYYARRRGLAVWWCIASVMLVVLTAVVLVAAYLLRSDLIDALFGAGEGVSDFIGLILSAPVAIVAWVVTARKQVVQQGGPGRLLGYLLVWLVPTVVSLMLAVALRWFAIQPFRIPSGAMQPTLQVGDHILVSKWSYGYGRFSIAPLEGLWPGGRMLSRHLPQRGDVIVFRPPAEPDRDFVKRVIGVPGDRIQMISGVLHINGRAMERVSLGLTNFRDEDGNSESIQEYRETFPNGASYLTFDRGVTELDDTREYVVPAGHYFVMGDDRDNSADSRIPSVVGFVPLENVVGRVDRIISLRR
ncbi:MAG: signal peptidase I [Proteobacteria bacterium]|nr:signal peptidase I [Pseudomonadota bacterium]